MDGTETNIKKLTRGRRGLLSFILAVVSRQQARYSTERYNPREREKKDVKESTNMISYDSEK